MPVSTVASSKPGFSTQLPPSAPFSSELIKRKILQTETASSSDKYRGKLIRSPNCLEEVKDFITFKFSCFSEDYQTIQKKTL